MKARIAICAGAIVVAIGTWTALASWLFVWIGGLFAYFPMPLWTWWTYAMQPTHAGWTLVYLVWSGIAAAVPILVICVLMVLILRRGRHRRLVPPSGGGVRPIQPGVTDNHGNATILTDKEALRKFPGPYGVVIGELKKGVAGRAALVIDPITSGAGHSVVFAGTRAGKSMSAVTALMHWPGSAIVLDPSAEIGNMVRGALEEQGKRVVQLMPGSTGFNVASWVNPNKHLAGLDVKSLVAWIYPPENAKDTKTDGYFEPSGKALALTILADLLWSDRDASQKTLKTFRELARTPENLMPRLLAGIAARSNSPIARDIAGTLMKVAPKQFSGIYGNFVQGSDWLSDPAMAALTSGNGFNPLDILDGDTVIFVQIPLRALKQSPGVARVIIGSLMSIVYDGGREGDRRVLTLMDEARALGPMAIMEDALVDGAKFGLTLQFLYQSQGQAKTIWGEDGLITLFNNVTWRGYASIRDETTAEAVSREYGEIGVLAYSEGSNQGISRPPGIGWGSRSTGDNTNVHEIKRRLIMAQELKQAPADDLFVLSPHGNMRLRMPLYFRRPDLALAVKASRFSA